ncbi:MAG: CHAT domain-containing protein [Cyanobium sp.]
MPIQIQREASQQLLEGQQQALADTVASLGLPAGSGRVRSVAELQQRLGRATNLRPGSPPLATTPLSPSPTQAMAPYRPAILQLERADLPGGQVQLTAILLPASGEPVSHSQVVPTERLNAAIRQFQRQLISQHRVDSTEADSPGAQLASWLLEPMAPVLQASGSSALLLAVDRGLQAIPYAALPLGGQTLGERYALSLTPSLGLLDLDIASSRSGSGLLAVGASRFSQPLEPLPMVARELGALAKEQQATVLMEEAFTAEALRRQTREDRYQRLHIATHAEFQPGQNDQGRLFTQQGSVSLVELGASLRARAQANPLDLITLSACRTALGDERSELGFAGMALQAGARSGIGTLWRVDDGATAAFFVQYYRYLQSGLGKDQALQATVLAFRNGAVRLVGDALVGPRVMAPGDAPLILVPGPGERERLAGGLSHPYFWAGMVLTGSPW